MTSSALKTQRETILHFWNQNTVHSLYNDHLVPAKNGRYREFVPHHVHRLKPIRIKSQT